MIKKLLLTVALFYTLQYGYSQNIGINATGAVPDASAGLDVSFADKGFLAPRVALTASNTAGPIATPATGLLVYNTATAGIVPNNVTPGYYYWNGTAWARFMMGNGNAWVTTGNAGTVATANFLGTTDAVALRIRTSNIDRFEFATNGRLRSFNNGTAALPTYSWNVDPDNGMYRITTNTVGFATGGIERFRMSATSAVFNELSYDYDFRIESNNQINTFFVDGGTDAIGFSGVPTAPFELGTPVHSMYYPFEIGNDGNSGAQITLAYYRGSDPTVNPEQNGGWGYVGYNATGAGNDQYWWRGYSGGWINVSQRSLKRDIETISDDNQLESYLIKSILNMKPSLYNYNNEKDEMLPGLENHYRPAYRIGLIADESPDYILDESFSGVDIYGLATLSLVGVQYNMKELNKLKKTINIQDFGTNKLTGKEMWVYFSENFEGTTPVITLTANDPAVVLSIVEKNDKGFKVIASRESNDLNFDWIAMAKVKENATPPDQAIDIKVKNKLEVPSETKTKILNFYDNFKPSMEYKGPK